MKIFYIDTGWIGTKFYYFLNRMIVSYYDGVMFYSLTLFLPFFRIIFYKDKPIMKTKWYKLYSVKLK